MLSVIISDIIMVHAGPSGVCLGGLLDTDEQADDTAGPSAANTADTAAAAMATPDFQPAQVHICTMGSVLLLVSQLVFARLHMAVMGLEDTQFAAGVKSGSVC